MPGKPLAKLGNKPLIQYVYEQARAFRLFTEVIVATDDQRILKSVEGFGGKAVLTGKHHLSGTDRVAEVAEQTPADVIVNLQSDELGLTPAYLERLIRPFVENTEVQMTTLAHPVRNGKAVADPNLVKIVVDTNGNALYFTRYPVPFLRAKAVRRFAHLAHIGVYAYRKEFLLRLTHWVPTPLETIESLEQLRVLEHGEKIKVVVVDSGTLRIDTPADLRRAHQDWPRWQKKFYG